MGHTKTSLLIVFAIFQSFGCATSTPRNQANTRAPSQVSEAQNAGGHLSLISPDQLSDVIVLDQTIPDQVVDGKAVSTQTVFVTYYNKAFRLPEFSEYTLTAEHLSGPRVKRKNTFHADDQLSKMGLVPVTPDDYKGSGYDKGHMAPSGDFAWSPEANDATFVMSNMCPQAPKLNQQAWERLETQVRKWACAAGRLRVITGPVLTSGLPTLASGVPIPQKFYKIIVDENPASRKAIAFVMSQADSARSTYLTSHFTIREVEAMTGIDFFAHASTAERTQLEDDNNLNEWPEGHCQTQNSASQATAGKPAVPGVQPPTPSDSDPVPSPDDVAPVPIVAQPPVILTCTADTTLKAAHISGCCRGRKGVAGPKKNRACCSADNQVLCNNGQYDDKCQCD